MTVHNQNSTCSHKYYVIEYLLPDNGSVLQENKCITLVQFQLMPKTNVWNLPGLISCLYCIMALSISTATIIPASPPKTSFDFFLSVQTFICLKNLISFHKYLQRTPWSLRNWASSRGPPTLYHKNTHTRPTISWRVGMLCDLINCVHELSTFHGLFYISTEISNK